MISTLQTVLFKQKKISENSKKFSTPCFQSVDLRESLNISEKKMSYHFILFMKGSHLWIVELRMKILWSWKNFGFRRVEIHQQISQTWSAVILLSVLLHYDRSNMMVCIDEICNKLFLRYYATFKVKNLSRCSAKLIYVCKKLLLVLDCR